MANLETLELTINGSAKSASEGIDQLIRSLSYLPSVIGKSVSGLVKLNAELDKLKKSGAIKLPNLGKVKGVEGLQKATKAIKESKEALYDVEHNNGRGPYNPPKMDPVKEAAYNQQLAEAIQRNKEQLAYRRYMNNFYREKARLKELGLFREGNETSKASEAKPETAQATQQATQATKEYKNAVNEAKESTSGLKQETKKAADATESGMKQMKKSIESVTRSSRGLLSQIARIAKMMLIRSAIRALMKAAKEGLENFYKYSKAIGSEYSKSLDSVKSKWNQFKNQLGAALGTALNAFLPVLKAIASVAITAVNWITALFALLSGQSTYSQAVEGMDSFVDSTNNATKAAKELLASFDELNVIQSSGRGGGSGSGTNFADMFQEVQLPQWMQEWKPIIEAILGGILGSLILPKIFDLVRKILNLFGLGNAKNALDILKRMFRLKDTDFSTPTDGVNNFLKKFTDNDVLDGIGDVSDLLSTLKNLDWKKLLIENIPGLLKLAIALLEKLIAGMSTTAKINVDRKEFDEFKKDFDNFKKDGQYIPVIIDVDDGGFSDIQEDIDTWVGTDHIKTIGLKFDVPSTYVFRMARDGIDNWVNEKSMKNIGVQMDPSTTYVFRIAKKAIDDWVNRTDKKNIGVQLEPSTTYVFRKGRDAINEWINRKDVKSIGVQFDPVQYLLFTGAKGIIDEWVNTRGTKVIGIMFDAIEYGIVLAAMGVISAWTALAETKTINVDVNESADKKTIDDWVAETPTKKINIMLLDNANGINQVSDWIAKSETKTVKVKMEVDDTGTSGSSGGNSTQSGNIFGQSIFDTTIEQLINYVKTHTIKDAVSDFWTDLGTQLGIVPEGNKTDVKGEDVVEIKYGTLVYETKAGFIQSMVDSYGPSAIRMMHSEFPDISAEDIISVTDWSKFESGQRTEFLDALEDAFGSNEAITKARNKGTNIASEIKGGMDSKTSDIKGQADTWDKEIDKALSPAHEIRIKENKKTTKEIATSVSSTISSIKPVINPSITIKSEQTNGIKTTIENVKPTIYVGATLKSGVTTSLKNDIESIHPNIVADVSAGSLVSFGKAIRDAVILALKKIKISLNDDGTWNVQALSRGGFVNSGDLFLANENGNAEMIGRFGSQTAVANNDQIVAGIANGVAAANAEQNTLLRRQNEILMGILQKEGTVRLGASSALGRIVKQSMGMYETAAGV